MVHAIVALLPLPVMPSSVCNHSPRRTPVARASIAPGWSPAGAKSDTTLNGGTGSIVPGGCDSYPGTGDPDGTGTGTGPGLPRGRGGPEAVEPGPGPVDLGLELSQGAAVVD